MNPETRFDMKTSNTQLPSWQGRPDERYEKPAARVQIPLWLKRLIAVVLVLVAMFVFYIPFVAMKINLRKGGGFVSYLLQGFVWGKIWRGVTRGEKTWLQITLWTLLGPIICAFVWMALSIIYWTLIMRFWNPLNG